MADQLVTAKFVLDSSGFNDGLKGINAELRNARSELGSASTAVGTFGRDSEKLKGVQEALTRQVELHSKKVDLYKDSIDKTTVKMNDNIKERDKLKTSLDNANKSYDKAVEMYGKESTEAKKAKEEVERLEKEYKNKEAAVESNAKTIQNYETNMNSATAQMNRTQGQLNEVNEELARSENKWLGASKTLEEHSEKLKKVGGGMESAGKKILGMTAPLIGVGVASLKVSTDFEAGMSNVQALSQATGKDFDDLKEKAKEMGSKTSMSATEASDGMANLALAGWDTTQIIGGIEPVLRLAEAGTIDLARASSLTTDSMSAMGLEVDDLAGYLDLVAQTARSSNTDIDQMMEAYLGVGGVLRGLKAPLDDSAVSLGMLANAGIKGSEAGKGLSSILTNLTAPTGRAKKALDELGFTAFDAGGEFKGLDNVLFELKDMTKDMTDENKNMYLSMIGGKEHIKTLNALMNGLDDSYVDLKNDIGQADGALNEMAETMQDNTKGDIVKLKSQLKGVGIQIGEVLIPYVRDGVKVVSNLVDKFAELDPKTQEMIVKASGLAIGLGGVLLVGGKLVSGAGALAGGLSTVAGWLGTTSAAATGMGTAAATAGGVAGTGALTVGLGGVIATAAPFVLAGGAIVGAAIGIKEYLTEEALPAVDRFGYGISETTQESVGAFLDLEEKATTSLKQLAWSGEEVTAEMKESIGGNFEAMKNTVVTELDEQKAESINILTKLFSESETITKEELAKDLKRVEENYEDKKKKTEEGNRRIQEILENARKEKRELKESEVKEIETLNEVMKKDAVRILSDSEEEQLTILRRLELESGNISARQATEIVKNSLETKEKVIAEAEEQYTESLKYAAQLRREGGAENEALADKVEEEALRQKNAAVVNAGKMHQEVVSHAKQQAKEHVEQIDWESGELKTKWGELRKWFANNPIVRKIQEIKETMSSTPSQYDYTPGSYARNIDNNWRGNPNYSGGLTTLHEKGYEVYNLPRGTRIYNNEASEDMVIKTAEAVARRIVDGSSGGKGVNVTQNIYVPTPSPAEVARQTKRQLQTMAFDL